MDGLIVSYLNIDKTLSNKCFNSNIMLYLSFTMLLRIIYLMLTRKTGTDGNSTQDLNVILYTIDGYI